MQLSPELGKDVYAKKYQANIELHAQWLNFGAHEKANSIQQLLIKHAIKPRNMLELGCGTGAVLEKCQQRGLADNLYGVDYSEDAIGYLKIRVPGVTAFAADILNDDLHLDDEFDVVVLSHVLEHLEEPEVLLKSLTTKLRFKYLIAEVPLEDLALLKVRSKLWGRPGIQAGHVQFYTQPTFESLLRTSGYNIIDRRQYLPIPSRQALEIVRVLNQESRAIFYRRLIGRYLKILVRPIMQRLYYAHHACLCVQAQHFVDSPA